jgi:hypothetical protein
VIGGKGGLGQGGYIPQEYRLERMLNDFDIKGKQSILTVDNLPQSTIFFKVPPAEKAERGRNKAVTVERASQ